MENGNEKSVGTVIGEALRPTSILDALYASRRELDAEIAEETARLRELEARRFDMSEQVARIEGDALAADYYRAEAAVRRADTAETRQAVHVAFIEMMAHVHLKHGTVPTMGGVYGVEIEQRLDELRARSVQ